MRRREFGGCLTAGAIGLTPGAVNAVATPRRNALMHVGGDYHSVLRYGVKHLTAQLRKRTGGGWDADDMNQMRGDCDRFGVVFEAIRMDAKPRSDRLFPWIKNRDTGNLKIRYVSSYDYEAVMQGGGRKDCIHSRHRRSVALDFRGERAPPIRDSGIDRENAPCEAFGKFGHKPRFQLSATVANRQSYDALADFPECQDA